MNDNLTLTNIVKNKFFNSIMLGLLLAAAMATQASAQTILIDDFNDGNADGWTISDGSVGQSWGPGTIEVSRSGAYHFEGAGFVPARGGGGASAMTVRWDQSSDPVFTDGFVRVKVRTAEGGNGVAIVLRTRPNYGYVFFGNTVNNRFRFNAVVNGTAVRYLDMPGGPAFGINEDWYIEAGAVGTQLSMKVWRVGDPEPESPQWTLTDTRLPTGQFGIAAFVDNRYNQSGRVSGTFDDISFRFPEHDDPFTPAPYDIYLWGSPMPLPQEEGPFFVIGSPEKPDMRGDVTKTEGWPDLSLTGNITDFQGRPIPGLKLDFWQADDNGSYDNSGGYNLRGHLFTDTEGNYNLWTVMPSIYEVIRNRHLHLKIGGQNLDFDSPIYTTQLYFPAPYDSDIDADGTPDKVVQEGFETEFDAISLEEDFITMADLEAAGAEFSDLVGNIVTVNNDPAADGYFDTMLNIVMPKTFQSPEMAKRILIDNFNDGDADGWRTRDQTTGRPWGPGIFEVTRTGAYHLEMGGIAPGILGRGYLASYWDQSSDSPIFSDGFLQAKVRVETLGSMALLLLRISGNLDTGADVYQFGPTMSFGGGFVFVKIVKGVNVQVRRVPGNFSLRLNDWWNIEAGAVGDQLSMKVWRDGEPEPEFPQLVFRDSDVLGPGYFGVQANIDNTFREATRASATFDDIYFTPDPSLRQ